MNQELLQQYAALAVRVGINPQKGQTVIISAPIEGAAFARLCAQEAYNAGAREVVVKYEDEKLNRIRMERTDLDVLTDVKPHVLRSYLDYAEGEGGVCILNLVSSDPEIYKGLDPEKINRVSAARRAALKPWRDKTMKDEIQWSILAIPSPAWAAKIFSGQSDAEEKLWNAIFEVCRVKEGGDVVAAWKAHVDHTLSRRDKMNSLCLQSVHLKSANGTDLEIGLADGHVWGGAQGVTPEGCPFIGNIPTEEVFTCPHRERVNGVVYGTKPYVYNGNLIENFWVRFENGLVVEHHAEKGEELLGKLLDTDPGARRIGEIALVPASSPINQSGLLFYNTLFDENAACHIAFGQGYPGTVEGGNAMTQEELLNCGVNSSLVHEDVMVGAADMTITGFTKDGEAVSIFEKGEWAF